MIGAERRCIAGYAWHLTHRCHERELLLKTQFPYSGSFEHENSSLSSQDLDYRELYPADTNG
jgi:hypothetical protein